MPTTRILILFLILFNVGLCQSPQEVLTAYKNACQADNFEKSWALEAQNKDLPERLKQQQRDLAQFNFEHRKEGSDFEILAERIDGDCAMIIINEIQKEGQPAFDLDPVCLIKQDDKWRICRTQKRLDLVAADKAPVFAKLQAWFEGFEQGVEWQQNREPQAK
jgi:hypothetical protein